MSTEAVSTAGQAVPAIHGAPIPSGTAIVQTPAEQVTASTAAEQIADPSWLKSRLDRERAKGASEALHQIGVGSADEAKTAVAAAKMAADAKKSAEERAIEAGKTAESEKARADKLHAIATEHAARMMVGLTAEQQAAVKSLAGEDPAQQLHAIHALTPTWGKASTTAEKGSVAAGAATATTAPPASAPSGVVPPATEPRAVYDASRTKNPFAAAHYGAKNPQVYDPK